MIFDDNLLSPVVNVVVIVAVNQILVVVVIVLVIFTVVDTVQREEETSEQQHGPGRLQTPDWRKGHHVCLHLYSHVTLSQCLYVWLHVSTARLWPVHRCYYS